MYRQIQHKLPAQEKTWIHHLLKRNLPFRCSPQSLWTVPQMTHRRWLGTNIKTVNRIKDNRLARTLTQTLEQSLSSTVTERFNQAARPSPNSMEQSPPCPARNKPAPCRPRIGTFEGVNPLLLHPNGKMVSIKMSVPWSNPSGSMRGCKTAHQASWPGTAAQGFKLNSQFRHKAPSTAENLPS